jgi:hypothetical protein
MSKSRLPNGPGPRAKRTGTPVKNGKGIPVWSYPREKTRACLVKASERAGQSLGAFLILAGLEKIARMKMQADGETVLALADMETAVQKLIPEEEYAELLRKRGGKGGK